MHNLNKERLICLFVFIAILMHVNVCATEDKGIIEASLSLSYDDFQGCDWSQNGTQVLITAEREGIKELWVVSLSDGKIQRLSPLSDTDKIIMEDRGIGGVSWSKANNMIAFDAPSQVEGIIRGCWITAPEGRSATKIPSGDLIYVAFPSWSPDGKFIVCEAISSSEDNDKDIFIFPIKEGGIKRLTSDKTEDRSPSWSPDGKTIAFISYKRGKPGIEIWTVPSEGSSSPKQVTFGLEPAGLLSWTPDSKHIVFCKQGEGVLMISAEGGTPRRILEGNDIISAVVSPAGDKIMYTRKIKAYNKTLRRVYVTSFSGPAK